MVTLTGVLRKSVVTKALIVRSCTILRQTLTHTLTNTMTHTLSLTLSLMANTNHYPNPSFSKVLSQYSALTHGHAENSELYILRYDGTLPTP